MNSGNVAAWMMSAAGAPASKNVAETHFVHFSIVCMHALATGMHAHGRSAPC